MTNLPYVFDLLYDFKTVEQLHDHLTGVQRCATSATDEMLIGLCVEHDIPLPPSVVAAPTRADLQAALALCVEALDSLLPHLARVPADIGLINDALVAARPLLVTPT